MAFMSENSKMGTSANSEDPDEMPHDSSFHQDLHCLLIIQKVSEYDQAMPQSHTADQPTSPRGRATEHL